MLNLDFLEKGLGIVFPPHFVYDFSKEMFLMLYILLSDQLSLLHAILGNMYIVIVCFPNYDVINFEINIRS